MATLSLLVSVLLGFNHALGREVVIGVLGNSVSIECKLPVSETLVWDSSDSIVLAMNGTAVDRQSGKYVIVKLSEVQETLVIHNLTLEDEKTFRCYDLQNVSTKELTKLDVLVQPTYMNLTSLKDTLLEGDQVLFRCEAVGGKPLPEITWHRIGFDGSVTTLPGRIKDTMNTNGTGHRESSLTVLVTRELYRSTFVCNITVPVFYQQGFELTPEVMLAPEQPRIYGYAGSYDADLPLTLECNSSGSRPAADIAWYLAEVRVSDSESAVQPEPDGTFTVRSFLSQRFRSSVNGSRLTCAVTNTVLMQQNIQPLTAGINLRVTYKPVLRPSQPTLTSTEGSNVTLWCDVDAFPFPDVTSLSWRHNDNEVDRDLYLVPDDSTQFGLTLDNVNRSSSGIYTCHAANSVGSATSQPLSVTVYYRPSCTKKDPVTLAVSPGNKARLHCPLTGFPSNMSVTWQHQGTNELLQPVTSHITLDDDDHVIAVVDIEISSSDYGSVLCYGENMAGASTAPCIFHVVRPGPPERPTDCQTRISGRLATVYCTSGFDGGSQQSFLLEQFDGTKFESVMNHSSPQFSFTLSSNTSVRICAVNDQFPFTVMCSLSVFIQYKLEDPTHDEPILMKQTSTSVYIAGGCTAFGGLVIISGIVVVLLRKNNKDIAGICKTEKQEKDVEAGSTVMMNKPFKHLMTMVNSVREQTLVAIQTPARQLDQPVTMDTNNDVTVPFVDIVLLASTPYVPGRRTQHWNDDSTLSPVTAPRNDGIVSSNSTSSEFAPTLDLLNHSHILGLSSTGQGICARGNTNEVMDKIKVVDGTMNNTFPSFDMPDQTIVPKPSQHCGTTAATLEFDYSAADIADVLDHSKANEIEDNYTWQQLHEDFDRSDKKSIMTLDKDYTFGDIASVLDDLGDTMAHPMCSRLHMTSCVIDGTRLSFEADFSESATDSVSQDEGNSRQPRRQQMRKSRSLPFRFKSPNTNCLKACKSGFIKSADFCNNSRSCGNIVRANDKQLKVTSTPNSFVSDKCSTSSRGHMNSTCDLSTISNNNTGMLFDIDRFTLTVTSDTTNEFENTPVLSEEETVIDTTLRTELLLAVLSPTSCKRNSLSLSSEKKSPVRNESFIRAVSFDGGQADDCEDHADNKGTTVASSGMLKTCESSDDIL